jgi:hypothetical protein
VGGPVVVLLGEDGADEERRRGSNIQLPSAVGSDTCPDPSFARRRVPRAHGLPIWNRRTGRVPDRHNR